MTEEQQRKALDAVATHIAYWRATNTELQFIPHASTWLNQERYEDELEIPKPKLRSQVIPGWWTNERIMLQMASQFGISTMGLTVDQLRVKLKERIAA